MADHVGQEEGCHGRITMHTRVECPLPIFDEHAEKIHTASDRVGHVKIGILLIEFGQYRKQANIR